MIPTIEDIVAGLIAKEYGGKQAIVWLHQHLELSYQGGRSDGPGTVEQERRDLRDQFAGFALCGLVATEFAETATVDLTATEAYLLADAMLKARVA